jgi:UDP-glucose 4-epimerase
MKNLLITGSGTIGNMVASQASKNKEFDRIFLADINPHKRFISSLVDTSNVEIRRLNVTSFERVMPFFSENKITHVIDTVCIPNTPELRDLRLYVDVNSQGLLNLLDASRLTGVEKFVYCSSNAVYDFSRQRPTGPVKEDWPSLRTDATIYDHTKFLGERLVAEYRRVFGLAGASFRLTVVYGPCPALNMGSKTWFHNIVMTAALTKKLNLDGVLRKRLCWMYSRDAANALIHAVLHKGNFSHDLYNVSSGVLAGVEELVECLKLTIKDLKVTIGEIKDSGWKYPLDITLLREDLGFVPSISLDDAVKEYVKWVQDNPDIAGGVA